MISTSLKIRTIVFGMILAFAASHALAGTATPSVVPSFAHQASAAAEPIWPLPPAVASAEPIWPLPPAVASAEPIWPLPPAVS